MSLALTARRALLTPPWVKNELWRRARAVPSLDQRFAESLSLIDAVSGQQLITFTRASDGTFVGSNGLIQTAGTNVPRFTHDPVTLESLGLLVEEQRANLLLRSEELETTWGSNNYTITSNLTAAPDGANTADKLIRNTLDATAPVSQNVTVSASTAYTLSLYAKAAEWGKIGLREGSTTGNYVTFDLATASVVSTQIATGSIASVGNGWFRLTMTMTTSGGQSSYGVRVIPLPPSYTSGTPNYSFAGDGTSGLFIWGAQLEAGASATSYIPTTTATVTRSASVADVINQSIASNIRTLYLEFRSPASGTRGVVSLNDNTANERVNMLTSGTDPRLVVVDGGVEQANINGGTITANTRTRVAVRINENDFAISINGAAVVTDTSGTLPTVDRLMLGRTQAGEYLNGTLARVTGWREALPNSTLQTLAG